MLYSSASSEYWQRIIELLDWKLRDKSLRPIDRAFLGKLLHTAQDGKEITEEELTRAKNIGVRNPAFEGDLIGWWDENEPYEAPDDPSAKKSDETPTAKKADDEQCEEKSADDTPDKESPSGASSENNA